MSEFLRFLRPICSAPLSANESPLRCNCSSPYVTSTHKPLYLDTQDTHWLVFTYRNSWEMRLFVVLLIDEKINSTFTQYRMMEERATFQLSLPSDRAMLEVSVKGTLCSFRTNRWKQITRKYQKEGNVHSQFTSGFMFQHSPMGSD